MDNLCTIFNENKEVHTCIEFQLLHQVLCEQHTNEVQSCQFSPLKKKSIADIQFCIYCLSFGQMSSVLLSLKLTTVLTIHVFRAWVYRECVL